MTVVQARADLSIVKSANPASPSAIFANIDPLKNTVIHTITVTNAGPSDAQNVKLFDALSPKLINPKYCLGSGCDPTAGSTWSSPVTIGLLAPGSQVLRIASQADPGLPVGATSVSNAATATADTLRLDNSPNNQSSNSVSTDIHTVPATPTLVSAQAGNAQVGIVWDNGVNGGETITDYVITVTPAPAGYPKTPTAAMVTPVSGQPGRFSFTLTGLANDTTTYSIKIKAHNAVGFSGESAALYRYALGHGGRAAYPSEPDRSR